MSLKAMYIADAAAIEMVQGHADTNTKRQQLPMLMRAEQKSKVMAHRFDTRSRKTNVLDTAHSEAIHGYRRLDTPPILGHGRRD